MKNDIVTRLREMWGDDDRCIWCKKHMDSASSPHRSVCDLMEAADEIERLRGLLMIFDDHFVCEECDKACATYLQGCENPLHALHTAAWERF